MTSCCFESEFQQLRTSCEFGAYTCRQCSGQMPHSVMVSHGKSNLMNGFKGCIYVCAFTVSYSVVISSTFSVCLS